MVLFERVLKLVWLLLFMLLFVLLLLFVFAILLLVFLEDEDKSIFILFGFIFWLAEEEGFLEVIFLLFELLLLLLIFWTACGFKLVFVFTVVIVLLLLQFSFVLISLLLVLVLALLILKFLLLFFLKVLSFESFPILLFIKWFVDIGINKDLIWLFLVFCIFILENWFLLLFKLLIL